MSLASDCELNIDVVIVNYNAGTYITELVGILKQDGSFNIQVVDNHSSDGSTEALISMNTAVTANLENKGFATACNQGAALGQSPYIAFVNPDCLLNTVQLKQLAQCAVTQEAGLVGCQVMDVDGSVQRGTWRRLPTLWRVLLTVTGMERFSDVQGLNLKNAPDKTEAINGACYVVKRSVFESIKGFDELFPLHFEDLDLFKRIQDAGHALHYANDIKIKHIKGYSSTDSRQVQAWKKMGLLRYFKKHRPAWECFVMRLLTVLK